MDTPVDIIDMSYEQFERRSLLKGDFFFGAVGRILRSRGNEVIEIDDPELCAKKLELARKVTALSDNKFRNNDWLPNKKERRLGRALATIDLIDSVLREDHMLEAIPASDAGVVILGRAHADQLAANRALKEKLALTVKEYVWVVPDDTNFRSGLVDRNEHAPSYLYTLSISEIREAAHLHTIRRTLDTRKHNAFTIGRVLGASAPPPDYLGRFYLFGLTAHSMFELAIGDRNGSEFSGKIMDVLGDAEVEGSFDQDGVKFTKRYVIGQSFPAISSDPIYYRTTEVSTRGVYSGRYDLEPDTRHGCVFNMVNFSNKAVKLLDKQ
jgi:hypothetical protein